MDSQTINQAEQPLQQMPQVLQPQNAPANDSKNAVFIGVGIVVLLVVIVAVVFLMKSSVKQYTSPSVVTQNIKQSIQTGSSNPTVAASQNQQTGSAVGNALPPGNSDTQLDQDMQTVDKSLGAVDTNLGAVDQGLNDQQTNLTE